MSKNIELTIGMKFYPFLVKKGNLFKIKNNKMKAIFDKKDKIDLVKYFPKPVIIRINNENKIKTIGEGNLIDIKDYESDKLILEILLEPHTIIDKDFLQKINVKLD